MTDGIVFFLVVILVIACVYTKAIIIAEYDRITGHVRAHLRGRGKPSKVLKVCILMLLAAAVVIRAAQ